MVAYTIWGMTYALRLEDLVKVFYGDRFISAETERNTFQLFGEIYLFFISANKKMVKK